ncbi:MAG: hypothetical protein HY566_02185 [Candidatus Kerfeldbacteria bacterium]|nr:hypothetical protein [Candidatus Kerfeldbacteria bacterium]
MIYCNYPMRKDVSRTPLGTGKIDAKTGVQFFRARGFGLIEIVITIGITSMVLAVVLSINNVLKLQQSAYYRTVARQLMVEESEALRNASFADLHNRTNTPFIETAYSNGSWEVAQPATPKSSPNVLVVQDVIGSANPSRIVLPAGNLGDGTSTLSFRIRPTSPANWKVGFYLRYHDDQNYYLLQATATALTLSKVVEGVTTQLWTNATVFTANTWYGLSVTVTGQSFTSVLVDGTLQTGLPVTDATFARGSFALGAFDSVQAEFDDVSFSGAGSASWNFDGASESIGSVPRGWSGMGPPDLPSGSTNITITDAQSGYTDLKSAALTVTWQEPGGTKSLTNTFYIFQQSVAP